MISPGPTCPLRCAKGKVRYYPPTVMSWISLIPRQVGRVPTIQYVVSDVAPAYSQRSLLFCFVCFVFRFMRKRRRRGRGHDEKKTYVDVLQPMTASDVCFVATQVLSNKAVRRHVVRAAARQRAPLWLFSVWTRNNFTTLVEEYIVRRCWWGWGGGTARNTGVRNYFRVTLYHTSAAMGNPT